MFKDHFDSIIKGFFDYIAKENKIKKETDVSLEEFKKLFTRANFRIYLKEQNINIENLVLDLFDMSIANFSEKIIKKD